MRHNVFIYTASIEGNHSTLRITRPHAAFQMLPTRNVGDGDASSVWYIGQRTVPVLQDISQLSNPLLASPAPMTSTTLISFTIVNQAGLNFQRASSTISQSVLEDRLLDSRPFDGFKNEKISLDFGPWLKQVRKFSVPCECLPSRF